MCGGWACASYHLACNNPPLSTIRFTGREFIPTPCGPHDKCFVKDTSCSRGTCLVPHNIPIKMNPCLEFATPKLPQESETSKKTKELWKTAYEKVKNECNPAATPK